jgi:hypothetical protein
MRTRTPEMIAAAARVAQATRWHGPDSREVAEARRELAAAKLERAQAQAEALQAEIARLRFDLDTEAAS